MNNLSIGNCLLKKFDNISQIHFEEILSFCEEGDYYTTNSIIYSVYNNKVTFYFERGTRFTEDLKSFELKNELYPFFKKLMYLQKQFCDNLSILLNFYKKSSIKISKNKIKLNNAYILNETGCAIINNTISSADGNDVLNNYHSITFFTGKGFSIESGEATCVMHITNSDNVYLVNKKSYYQMVILFNTYQKLYNNIFKTYGYCGCIL